MGSEIRRVVGAVIDIDGTILGDNATIQSVTRPQTGEYHITLGQPVARLRCVPDAIARQLDDSPIFNCQCIMLTDTLCVVLINTQDQVNFGQSAPTNSSFYFTIDTWF